MERCIIAVIAEVAMEFRECVEDGYTREEDGRQKSIVLTVKGITVRD